MSDSHPGNPEELSCRPLAGTGRGERLPDPASLPHFDEEELRQEPIERASTIPASWYTSPDILQLEREVLFSDFWQLAAHDSQIPEAGDVHHFEAAGNPLMLLRDAGDKVRAFYNVCRHRGGPVDVKKGTSSVLQCRYHGWTYKLDGSLRGVPQFNRVDLFDKKDFGLVPVERQAWQGLHFVRLNEGGPDKPDLENLLDGISNRIAPITLDDYKYCESRCYTVNCNWKVYVDNFLEGYHIPIVHPELAKLLDYRDYVTENARWHTLQHSPFREGENLYRSKDGQAWYYFVFPNIMLNILPNRLQTNVVRPLSAETTEVDFHYFYTDLESPDMQEMIAEDIAYSDKIQQEDIEICELVQRGLGSRAYHKGRFSVQREQGVYHFQSLIKEMFRKVL